MRARSVVGGVGGGPPPLSPLGSKRLQAATRPRRAMGSEVQGRAVSIDACASLGTLLQSGEPAAGPGWHPGTRRWAGSGQQQRVKSRPGGGRDTLRRRFPTGGARMRSVVSAGLLFCAAALAADPAPQPAPVIAVRSGRLLDPAQQKVLTGAVVVIQNGRTHSVGSVVPAGAQVVDASALTVSPGFIDAHALVLIQGDATEREYDDQIL